MCLLCWAVLVQVGLDSRQTARDGVVPYLAVDREGFPIPRNRADDFFEPV